MSQILKRKCIVFSLGAQSLSDSLTSGLNAQQGTFESRSFPDGETYLKLTTDVRGADCIVLMDLSRPNAKFLPLIFLTETFRELGAASVGLVAPYLCYMRQDRRFTAGEAITSKLFASTLSRYVDWLVTVDPHLHRYESLAEIYSIPSKVVQGAPALADWLKSQKSVLLVGPDAESEQWVSQIAAISRHPFVIGEKQRRGDRDVVIKLPALASAARQRVMIIDDVIASGYTILQCLKALRLQGVASIGCAAVHGIFADGIDSVLMQSGLAELATTNTIKHSSNCIDISPLLIPAVTECLSKQEGLNA